MNIKTVLLLLLTQSFLSCSNFDLMKFKYHAEVIEQIHQDKDYAFEVAESFLDYKAVDLNENNLKTLNLRGTSTYIGSKGESQSFDVEVHFYKFENKLRMRLRLNNASEPVQKRALEWMKEYMTMLN